MRKNNYGFTLVEMMVAVAILAVMSVSAVAIFARSLRSSTSIDTKQRQDEAAKNVIDNITRLVREAKIVSINGQTPVDCLAGANGYVDAVGAAPLVFKTLDSDIAAVINWEQAGSRGFISSNSASLSANNVNVTNFTTRWYCSEAKADRLNFSFSLGMIAVAGYDIDVSNPARNYSFDVLLRNERK